MKINLIYLLPIIAPAAVVVVARGIVWGCGVEWDSEVAGVTAFMASICVYVALSGVSYIALIGVGIGPKGAGYADKYTVNLKWPWGNVK
jgi:uncharacterized membrane protein